MAQETNQAQVPLLCTTGCGFYGNPRNNGMCSLCYKDFLQRQNSNERLSPPVPSSRSMAETLPTQPSEGSLGEVPPAPATPQEKSSEESQASVARSEEDDSALDKLGLETEELQASGSDDSDQASVEGQDKSSEKPKKNRCFTCRKKVGLTGFDCRCGNVFCGIHRYSDIHNCDFDYKADAAEKIRKENPVCVGEKIQKI